MTSNLVDKTTNIDTFSLEISWSNKLFGFWLYLMSDCIVFATLFSVYMVMKDNVANGPSGPDIFNFPVVILESLLLLFSSFSYSFIFLEIKKCNKIKFIFWLIITFLLGLIFLILEIFELYSFIQKGYSPSRSGFLSAFFTLLSVHGIHVFSALIWILVMIKQIKKFGITREVYTKVCCLSLFWHFLDIIWIFVFSEVYLIGVIG
ncbi:MAG: cytochrome o ubiquinol oxidase subunit III [Buchnera aphidicola (Melaphis rhois)]